MILYEPLRPPILIPTILMLTIPIQVPDNPEGCDKGTQPTGGQPGSQPPSNGMLSTPHNKKVVQHRCFESVSPSACEPSVTPYIL